MMTNLSHKTPTAARGILLILAVMVVTGIGCGSVQAEPVQVGHVKAELISETGSITPGQPFRLGVRLDLDDHWHVYWLNAGDAGTPPGITWTLPHGFEAGEIEWPAPEFINAPPLRSFGYHDEILLPVTLTPNASIQPRESVTITALAEWLVCKEKCIPGQAKLTITLPVSTTAPQLHETWHQEFIDIDNRIPIDSSGWTFRAHTNDGSLIITMEAPDWYEGQLNAVRFFPDQKMVIDNASSQLLTFEADEYRLAIAQSGYAATMPASLTGVLVSESGWRGEGSESAHRVDVPFGESGAASVAMTSMLDSIWIALAFAFLGGLILNLMPCVLPVLSIKLMGLIEQSGSSRSGSLKHGLFFTLGVVSSFWILAGTLLLLRAGGSEIGWGFQLQSPLFVAVLALFFFLFGLNLLGLFEIGTSLQFGGRPSSGNGVFGTFLSGVLATVVATPCTAPFMGSALGYSLSQPPMTTMVIFTGLGAGMAFPYLFVSAFPITIRFLPKPGAWMVTMKQLLGFVLLATVLWLVWVFAQQVGLNATVILLFALLLASMGAWAYGRWSLPTRSRPVRLASSFVFGLLIVSGAALTGQGISYFGSLGEIAQDNIGGLRWEVFSEQRLAELRQQHKPVFIDFTAAWCLSCKVNERVALSSDQVVERFNQLGVTVLKADWTNRDDEISQALARYGRNSVPLYVLYSGDSGNGEAVILPEILSPSIVLEALNELDG